MRRLSNAAALARPTPSLHAPYIQGSRTIGGKTVTRLLTAEQLTRYQPWFDNDRRLKDLVAKLETASLHAIEQAERNDATGRPTG